MSSDFTGIEIETKQRYLTAAHIREQILIQAKDNVEKGLHVPMFFAFFPGVCRVFYLVDRAGTIRFHDGIETFRKFTTNYRPYRIAFVFEGVIEMSPDDMVSLPRSPYYNALSLVIQDRTDAHYSTHLIAPSEKTMTRELLGCLFDSDLFSLAPAITLLPVSFFDPPACPFTTLH